MTVSRIADKDPNFEEEFAALLRFDAADRDKVRDTVRRIIAAVRESGDTALMELSNRLDGLTLARASELEIPAERLAQAAETIDPLVREALVHAISRVRQYHEAQKRALGDQVDWCYRDEDGNELGQRVRAMDRAGIYVPGGKASYPSSVIMTTVPARVAGVGEVILTVPAPHGEISKVLLATAHLCGVDRLFTLGGAQAIAALALGTATIPRVDKIVGPGNIYVATAKEMVFGEVGIDMLAGPSEVVIVADDSTDVEWLVMDMFAQAEHDEMAQAILISEDSALLDAVEAAIDKFLPGMRRAQVIGASMAGRGALIHVSSQAAAARLVDRIAPEHLELAVADPEPLLDMVHHAGAIFVGSRTVEAVGDYCAGPSHVLPTSGTARFASPLGVYDFQVRTSVVRCSPAGAVRLGRDAAILATEEGLEAHARSASLRVKG